VKRFQCVCGQAVFFENSHCIACQRQLSFATEDLQMVAVEATDDGCFWRLDDPARNPRTLCQNAFDYQICNWLTRPGSPDAYCESCSLNQTIPDLSVPGNSRLWARLESAKRRLVYGLLALGLPHYRGLESLVGVTPPERLMFSFLADTSTQKVTTGYEDGLVTLALSEADDVTRAAVREDLGEPYRTLLGHFRHESGHFYWHRLIDQTEFQLPFRDLFGDERSDYAAALAQHYREGASAGWSDYYVSAYASAHPHEDWAETWAHYLHIRDTLDTAEAYRVASPAAQGPTDRTSPSEEFTIMLERWIPVTLAVNALNRSMGLPDAYPFVLPPPSIAKLQFVHRVVRANLADRR